MKLVLGIYLCWAIGAAAQTIEPRVRSKPEGDGQVTVVEVQARFVTAIRMPEPVNSVAVGDPALFQVEHSEREPHLVFVKALTSQPAETNLLVSTGNGHETSLLLVSHGADGKHVDFVVDYKRPTSFLIEPEYPSSLVGETVAAAATARPGAAAVREDPPGNGPTAISVGSQPVLNTPGKPSQRISLDGLLGRQKLAPLPPLYGEHPGVETTSGDQVRAGVSEVIDGGEQVIVLFSAVNPTAHAILLMPPQVQLGGKTKRTKFHHARWTTAEQLPVQDFRLSTRRLAPGERADGVILFERPPYKQSNETLFLQLAEAGAVDRPALAPIGFGVNKLREEAEDARQK